MPSDQELELFIDGAQGNQKLALCLVSRNLREIKSQPFDVRGVLDREGSDIGYLKDNFHLNPEVKQIVEYLKNTSEEIPVINYIDGWGMNKDFKDQNTIYQQLESFAAAAAAPPPPPLTDAGTGGEGAEAGPELSFTAPPAAAPRRPAAPPSADGGRAGATDWWSQAGAGGGGGGAEAGGRAGATDWWSQAGAGGHAAPPLRAADEGHDSAAGVGGSAGGSEAGGGGGGGDGDGNGNWFNQGAGNALGFVGGLLPAVYEAGKDIVDGRPEGALSTLSNGLGRAANAGTKKGLGFDALSDGWQAGIEDPAAAAQAAKGGDGGGGQGGDGGGGQGGDGGGGQGGDGGGGPRGGGQGGAADAKAQADAAAQAAAAAAAAAAAKAAAVAAAQPNPVADDDEKNKLKFLLTANPEARLEVFDEDDDKKKKQNNILKTLLKNEPNYKKNKDSAFIYFISPSDKSGANNTPLPYVTNEDFLKILAKNSFPKDSNKGIQICKMDLDPSSEGVVMGSSKLKEQHWIDVKDEKNTTRIFIDKDGFKNLTDYKNLLTTKFEKFLRGDSSTVLPDPVDNVADKGTIKNAIDGFGIVQNIVDKTGAAPASPAAPAALQTSVAVKLGINDEDIQKKAQEFAEDFLQRRIMKGNLNCEKEITPATFENQEIGHIKIVRPLADQKKIEVYKVGDSNLEYVNLALDSKQIMQISTSKIAANGITDVKYYNVGSSKQLSKQEINPDALKIKVNVFVKGNNEWIRHKIREGGDQSKGESKQVVAPFEGAPSEKVPKIFTIGKDEKSVTIGKGSGWRLGYVPSGNADVDIKIRRSKNGNYKIQYGKNNFSSCSCLSNYRGAYLINPDITEIEGVTDSNNQPEKLGFEKKDTILSNPFSCCRLEKFDKFQIEIKDEEKNKMVTLEVEKVGVRGNILGARNKFMVKEVSSRALPVTILDAQGVVSTTPSAAPAPTKTSCLPACLGGRGPG